jgi:hypothetical protein
MRKKHLTRIALIISTTLLSFSGIAGGQGSDKYFILYGSKAYELRDFKSGIIQGISVEKSSKISLKRSIELTKQYRDSLSKYLDKILMLSSRHKIDPVLVVSTIWVESKFKPKALSPVGAKGLMQVMPDTHKWIFGALLKKDPTLGDTEENKNLEAGIAYLAHLKEIIGNDKERVMIAYNMGPKYVLNRSKFKFNHDYYKKISKNFDQISAKLKTKGVALRKVSSYAAKN